MIKKFNEYIKESFEDEEEDDVHGRYHGQIETIDDIDWNQMNRLSSLYKNRYTVMIEYDLLLPDDMDGTEVNEELARKIAEEDISKMSNGEVRIESIHKVHKRF